MNTVLHNTLNSLRGKFLSRFEALDAEQIRQQLDALFSPSSDESIDPILGQKPDAMRAWDAFTRKHGILLQSSLLKLILRCPGWAGSLENTIEFEGENFRLDNLFVNTSENLAVFVECKRILDRQPGDAFKRIRKYDRLITAKRDYLAESFGLDLKTAEICFFVFDAYGKGDQKFLGSENICVVRGDELYDLLCPLVAEALADLDALTRVEAAVYRQRYDFQDRDTSSQDAINVATDRLETPAGGEIKKLESYTDNSEKRRATIKAAKKRTQGK